MADQDEEKVLADARKLPFSERVASKNWKVRSEAYENIASACKRALSETDACFDEFGTWESYCIEYKATIVSSHPVILLIYLLPF